jgi:transmembrane sensor
MSLDARARDLLLNADPDAIAAWRAEDVRHDEAFREAQLTWAAIGRTRFARDGAWRAPARPRPRWMVPAAAMAASLAIAAVIAPQVMGAPAQQVRTDIAQTRTVSLADGATVFVGAKSAVDLRMKDDARSAVLKGGEAFFEVAHDPARPFTVVAGGTVIRTSGGKFNVCRTPYGVQVAVLEGRVEVLRKRFLVTPERPDRVITGGEQVRLERGEGLSPPLAVNAEPGSWRQGRMQYADAPLKQVVADANRYSTRPIRLASNDIGDLRVTVSFRTRAVGELISNLDAGLPLSVANEAGGDIVLTADP